MTTLTRPSDPELDDRLARLEDYLEWSMPLRCPRCSSREICPMFDPDMLLWLCTDCGRPFCEAD